MVNKILLVLFLISFAQYSYSEEYTESTEIYGASFRIVFPDSAFLNLTAGHHFPIIPHVFSPGIAADVGIGLDWLKLFQKSEAEDEKDNTKDYDQLGFNLGARIYNLIEIGNVYIIPFIGYTVITGRPDEQLPSTTHNPMIGASIAIKLIGIEYSYYIPTRFSNNITFHHIAVSFFMRR